VLIGQSKLENLPFEEWFLIKGVGDSARLYDTARGRHDLDPVIGMDDACPKTMEEMLPSPVARKLKTKRSAPRARPC
jgi:hypothetical protein